MFYRQGKKRGKGKTISPRHKINTKTTYSRTNEDGAL